MSEICKIIASEAWNGIHDYLFRACQFCEGVLKGIKHGIVVYKIGETLFKADIHGAAVAFGNGFKHEREFLYKEIHVFSIKGSDGSGHLGLFGDDVFLGA